MLRQVEGKEGDVYEALAFMCPGCETFGPNHSGLHLLPVNGDIGKRVTWKWDGDLEAPTLSPSILTTWTVADPDPNKPRHANVCHSYLVKGVFQFLDDSTHELAGRFVPIPDLPYWITKEN